MAACHALNSNNRRLTATSGSSGSTKCSTRKTTSSSSTRWCTTCCRTNWSASPKTTLCSWWRVRMPPPVRKRRWWKCSLSISTSPNWSFTNNPPAHSYPWVARMASCSSAEQALQSVHQSLTDSVWRMPPISHYCPANTSPTSFPMKLTSDTAVK